MCGRSKVLKASADGRGAESGASITDFACRDQPNDVMEDLEESCPMRPSRGGSHPRHRAEGQAGQATLTGYTSSDWAVGCQERDLPPDAKFRPQELRPGQHWHP